MRKIVLSGLLGIFMSISAVSAAPNYDADVSVDVTAETVVDAKKKAMSKAIRDGLNEVVLRISTDEAVKEINKLNDNQIEHFISGVMVLMEKTSDVRYKADLRISVNEEVLRAYMEENAIPLVVGENKDILVIPLWESADGTLDLWGEENLWRQAFLERGNLRKGNLLIRSIDKNLGNIAAVKTNRAYNLENAEVAELLSFNRAEGLYVLKYSLKDGKVYVKDFSGGKEQEILIGGKSPTEMIDEVLPLFSDVKKNKSFSDDVPAVSEKIEVVYKYSKLSQWMSLRQILNNNPQVSDINIVSMANGKVHFNFEYSGVIEKLQGSLEINGYKLRSEGEYYAIY